MKILKPIIFVLFILTSCKPESNSQVTKGEVGIKTIIEEKNGMIYEYEVDAKNGLRNGEFKSYYIEGNQKNIALKATYLNGKLNGKMFHFIPDSLLITKYENIQYLKKDSTYTARILVYYENGKLKESGDVETKDEMDLSIIFETENSGLKKVNIKEWKYY